MSGCFNEQLKETATLSEGSNPGHDDALDVLEDRVPAVRLGGRTVGEQLPHIPGLHLRDHLPVSDGAQVLCDVVHQLFRCLKNRHVNYNPNVVNFSEL